MGDSKAKTRINKGGRQYYIIHFMFVMCLLATCKHNRRKSSRQGRFVSWCVWLTWSLNRGLVASFSGSNLLRSCNREQTIPSVTHCLSTGSNRAEGTRYHLKPRRPANFVTAPSEDERKTYTSISIHLRQTQTNKMLSFNLIYMNDVSLIE